MLASRWPIPNERMHTLASTLDSPSSILHLPSSPFYPLSSIFDLLFSTFVCETAPNAPRPMPADLERYSRQMLFAGIGKEGQQRLGAAKVLLCGCRDANGQPIFRPAQSLAPRSSQSAGSGASWC